MSTSQLIKKLVAALLVSGTCLCSSSMVLYASEYTTVNSKAWGSIDSSVITNGAIIQLADYEVGANTTITIPEGVSELTIEGGTGTSYSGLNIVAASRSTALKLTIKNLEIQGGTIDIAKCAADNCLVLSGNNKIVASNSAAVLVEGGENKLIIQAAEATATLIAEGANNSAGIGGKGIGSSGGHLVIEGAHITAKGADSAAGIGSGYQRGISSIKITGNAIIESSIGGNGGAGIGGSAYGNVIDLIEISGNAHIVSAQGGEGAAGIGAGNQSGVKEINIIGGTIESAQGGKGAAGIGSGAADKQEAGMKISITNATINSAQGGENGAGIGGGYERGANITIGSGAVIESAKGGTNAAGIGSGPNGEQRTIIIEGTALIKLAEGGANGAGIGGGNTRSATINITGGNIEYAKGGANAAGIGCGFGNNDANGITITGGVIYAEGGGGTNTNDIGAGNYYDVPGGKTQTDAKAVKADISGGSVFTPNNTVIGKIGSNINYTLIAYKNYDVSTKIGIPDSNLRIRLRTSDGMDKTLITDASGHTTFSWEEEDAAFNGYWLQVNDPSTGKIYVGVLATFDRSQWKTICYDKDNGVVPEGSSNIERRVIEMPLIFQEIPPPVIPPQITKPAGLGNKLVPYSTSNVGFSIDMSAVKTTDPQIQKIKELTCTLKTSQINTNHYSIEFDKKSGNVDAEVAVLKKDATNNWVYDSTMSSQCTATLASDSIAIKCVGDWIEANNFKIVVYLNTKGARVDSDDDGDIEDEASDVAVNTYKLQFVDTSSKLSFDVENISLKVDYKTPIIVGGSIVGYDISEVVIPMPNGPVEAQYYETPNII